MHRVFLDCCSFSPRFTLFINSFDDKFDKKRLCKRQTGKAYVLEMWNADKVWTKKCDDKNADRADYVTRKHPRFHTKAVVGDWICGEVCQKW